MYYSNLLDELKELSIILIAIIICAALVTAAFSAWVASRRGYDGGIWFLLGLFFGVIALLAVGLAPEKERETEAGPSRPRMTPEEASATADYLERMKNGGK
jgi:hypothetical protein